MPNFSGKWTQTQILYNDLGWYKPPGAPTSVSATVANAQSEVSFTAPTYAGNPATITGYRARATVQAGRTIAVTVANAGSGNKYNMDGSAQPTLTLIKGYTYTFDQSDSSNGGHPFRFSTTSDGTHGGGSEYTTGVTVVGTPGSAGAYTQIIVASDAPTLYYYCTVHSGMGGTANISTFNVEVTGSASPLTLTGLTNLTTYNISVQAQNAAGYGDAGTTTATPSPPGQIAYTTAGQYTFVAPASLNPATVSAVCVGAGGRGTAGSGGGGAELRYKNSISVTAGQSYNVMVGNISTTAGAFAGHSYFWNGSTCQANGGQNGTSGSSNQAGGSGGVGDGGGNGGTGSSASGTYGSGGGAGGYSGTGGNGRNSNSGTAYLPTANSGGACGGANANSYFEGGGGGGVGLLGSGTTGTSPGDAGSGGTNGNNSGPGGYFGGGSGGHSGNSFDPGHGGVRIIYSFNGTTRAFPSTNTGDI